MTLKETKCYLNNQRLLQLHVVLWMNLSANSNWKRNWFEPPHNKTNKMTVRPARLRSVWASTQFDPSLLCAQWVAKDPSFLHADSEDWSDWADAQADLSLHWAHSHFAGFVMRWLIYLVVASFSPFLQSHTTIQWLSSNPTDTNFLPSAIKACIKRI